MAIGRAAFRIGRFFQPAVKPLAFGAAGSGALLATAHTIRAAGAAANPPFQREEIDTDGDGKADGVVLIDTKTGRPLGFGPGGHPAFQGEDDRSRDRNQTTLLIAGVAAVGLVAAFALRK